MFQESFYPALPHPTVRTAPAMAFILHPHPHPHTHTSEPHPPVKPKVKCRAICNFYDIFCKINLSSMMTIKYAT